MDRLPPRNQRSFTNRIANSEPSTNAGLQTSLRYLQGIGPKRAEQLAGIGLLTVEDLLYHLPFRYEDRRRIKKIAAAIVGQEESFVGRLVALQKRFNPRRRAQMLTGRLADDSGVIGLVWYRAPGFLANRLTAGQILLVHGKVESGASNERRITHPEFEVLEVEDAVDPSARAPALAAGSRSRISPAGLPEGAMDLRVGLHLPKIVPVYLRPAGVSLTLMRKWATQAVADYAAHLPNFLPRSTKERLQLLDLPSALRDLHGPAPEAEVAALNDFSSPAHRTIIFDELFYLQLGLGLRKKNNRARAGVALPRQRTERLARMNHLLPFRLTGAQKRVLDEIFADMESATVMQRLIQGDVGAGKTMVAWYASLRVIDNGYQAVWMAPTELLAEQHFRSLKPYADGLNVRAALVTGSLPAKERKASLELAASGAAQLVLGTHALIQEGVEIPRMALGVIDEQHRFGVVQRLALQRLTGKTSAGSLETSAPHMLLMSATPIPRSLALVLYGDLDVSILDELPPGRTPISTKVYGDKARREVYALVLEQLRRGHQAFIVYPLVEASEQLQLVRDATQMAEKMRTGAFKEFGVGLVHGRMSPAERDDVMRAFRDGKLGVLVSTTVIEVGIDIPNATVMVIEHAERFGLSQLHQLRGRVGRGSAAGHCLLINRAPGNPLAAQRLRVMEKQHDGFKIAEADLAQRGPGEFLGTRQSGLGDFRLANLARDTRLLLEARREAQAWLQNDPNLESAESARMKEILLQRWAQRLQLGTVG
ncbi:MAG: ATP-dependent DNA helicase RecG [Deltaproteobacteria bacterium]|nr:ATP-dependent DNA helicase RecG [Deltaproteobacteria bacterium]